MPAAKLFRPTFSFAVTVRHRKRRGYWSPPADMPHPKVLMVISSVDPRQGGPPVSAVNIAVAARRSGIRVSCAVCIEEPVLPEERDVIARIEQEGVRLHAFPIWKVFSGRSKRWGVSVSLALWLVRSIRRYDVVQVHGAWLFSTLVAALAAKIGRRRLVVVPHETLTDFDIRTNASAFRRIAKRLVKAWLLWAADAIVFSSALEQRDSIRQRHAAKSTIIFHPVLDEARQRYAGRSWPGGLRTLRIGFLGRLHRKKNLDVLLEAVAQTPGVSLRVAGDGPAAYRAGLDELVDRLGLMDRVEWLGFISIAEAGAFFDSIDVLAMPSAYECFGRVAAEAMVHGVPTIVSESTGISEVVDRYRCGIVTRPDAPSIRMAIEKLQRDPAELDVFSARAIEASERELSLGSYGKAITRLYGAPLGM
jgi:glycosyltransferase involved in cell wall biosynthesis